jgi:hypothetical protein
MKNFGIIAIAAGVLAAAPAYAGGRAVAIGTPSSTTIKHSDGSKEVITPDGRHSFYNFDGSPRGINRTCSNGGGLIVNCHYWGPNSYGGQAQ